MDRSQIIVPENTRSLGAPADDANISDGPIPGFLPVRRGEALLEL
jgi:hypothetical protein